ncbi:MAG: cytochrome C oxidase subunit II [Methylocella sp.]
MNEQDIQKTERRWAAIVIVAVAIMLAVTGVSSFVMAMHPPSHVETTDPTTLGANKEFAENNLGASVNPDGSVTVRIIAAQFAFVPRCIPVPQGKPVTIRVTSPDVIHGFLIAGTNANTMVVPGYVSEIHTVFNEAGDHLMPCHEFCGLGHSEMWSLVRVIPQSEWRNDENGRASCDIPR